MDNPYCVLISGPSGSGKSTLAKSLWGTLEGHPVYLNLDSFKHFCYDAESTDHFLDLARTNGLSVTQNMLEAGHPVIVDKAFGSYEFVRPFDELASNLGLKSYYFKLNAPLEVLIERVEERRQYGLREQIKSGEWPLPIGDRTTATKIYQFFEQHKHEEGIEIDVSERCSEEVFRIVLDIILEG